MAGSEIIDDRLRDIKWKNSVTIVTNDNCKALFDMVHDMRSDAYFIDCAKLTDGRRHPSIAIGAANILSVAQDAKALRFSNRTTHAKG